MSGRKRGGLTRLGFVGSDPEQRQARNNGSKFTVLSVATQRSWKNAQDEWSSKTEWHRICIFRPRLAEYVLTAIQEGRAHPRRRAPTKNGIPKTEWHRVVAWNRLGEYAATKLRKGSHLRLGLHGR